MIVCEFAWRWGVSQSAHKLQPLRDARVSVTGGFSGKGYGVGSWTCKSQGSVCVKRRMSAAPHDSGKKFKSFVLRQRAGFPPAFCFVPPRLGIGGLKEESAGWNRLRLPRKGARSAKSLLLMRLLLFRRLFRFSSVSSMPRTSQYIAA